KNILGSELKKHRTVNGEVYFSSDHVIMCIGVTVVHTNNIGSFDKANISLSQYIVLPCVTRMPAELFCIELNNNRIIVFIDIHNIRPAEQSVYNESGKHDHRNNGPNEFQFIIIGKEKCFLSLSPLVFKSEEMKQSLGDHLNEHDHSHGDQ